MGRDWANNGSTRILLIFISLSCFYNIEECWMNPVHQLYSGYKTAITGCTLRPFHVHLTEFVTGSQQIHVNDELTALFMSASSSQAQTPTVLLKFEPLLTMHHE